MKGNHLDFWSAPSQHSVSQQTWEAAEFLQQEIRIKLPVAHLGEGLWPPPLRYFAGYRGKKFPAGDQKLTQLIPYQLGASFWYLQISQMQMDRLRTAHWLTRYLSTTGEGEVSQTGRCFGIPGNSADRSINKTITSYYSLPLVFIWGVTQTVLMKSKPDLEDLIISWTREPACSNTPCHIFTIGLVADL